MIRFGVQQIQDKSQVKLVKDFPRLRKIQSESHQHKFSKVFSLLLDLVRCNTGINMPWAVSPKSKYVLRWIPDCQDLIYPEFFSQDERERRKLSIAKSIRDGHAIYFSSEDSRRTFIQHYGDLRNVQGVVRFVAKNDMKSKEYLSVSKISCLGCVEFGYVYVPNQWWKHKNHILTIEAFLAYRKNGGKKHLVFTGTENDNRFPNFAHEIRARINGHSEIHPLGVVSREYQTELFKNADLLLQPSLCEGWSTTIEEGLYFGVPILASNIKVNMEQLEGCKDAIFFDSLSSEDLTLKLNYKVDKLDESALKKRREIREQRFNSDLANVISSAYNFISEKNIK